MTSDERIAQLEQEVSELKQHAMDTRSACLAMLGGARAFEIAVLSLLASTKHPEAVGRDLADRLQRLETQLVFESPSDEQLHGAQCAAEALMVALGDAQALPAPIPPAAEPECASAPAEQGGWVH